MVQPNTRLSSSVSQALKRDIQRLYNMAFEHHLEETKLQQEPTEYTHAVLL